MEQDLGGAGLGRADARWNTLWESLPSCSFCKASRSLPRKDPPFEGASFQTRNGCAKF